MCKKLDDVFLNVSTKVDKCQVIHIHNDELARFVIIAKFKFKKVSKGLKIKNINFKLKTQEPMLYFSLYRVSIHEREETSEETYKYRLKIILKPLSRPATDTFFLGLDDKNIILDPKNDEYINNEVKFLIDENTYDRLSRRGNVGDQACNFKII